MKFFALLLLYSSFTYAIDPMDDYYAADLLEAVDQAKLRPHHYDYSNHYRYKRTTAQSIDLNRLNLQELDETRLQGTQLNTTTSVDLILVNNKSEKLNTDKPLFDTPENIKIKPTIYTDSSYESIHGKFSSTGITGQTTLITTTRP